MRKWKKQMLLRVWRRGVLWSSFHKWQLAANMFALALLYPRFANINAKNDDVDPRIDKGNGNEMVHTRRDKEQHHQRVAIDVKSNSRCARADGRQQRADQQKKRTAGVETDAAATLKEINHRPKECTSLKTSLAT